MPLLVTHCHLPVRDRQHQSVVGVQQGSLQRYRSSGTPTYNECHQVATLADFGSLQEEAAEPSEAQRALQLDNSTALRSIQQLGSQQLPAVPRYPMEPVVHC